jgi:hypothetical protein
MIFKFFWGKLNIFLNKNDQVFFFHIYFSHMCKISSQEKKKKKLIMTCVFECFQSHCHILKELHEFFCVRWVR